MMTSSNGNNFPRCWPFVRGNNWSPLNSPHKGQWCGALIFSFICAWINGWVNNREAGDLKRHRDHYDVTAMIAAGICPHLHVNTRRPIQNDRNFPDIFKCIFLNEHIWISTEISPTSVPHGLINNIPVLVQIMVWRQPGDKPLSEPIVVSLLSHICVTRSQWIEKFDTLMALLHRYICHLPINYFKMNISKCR